MTRVEGTNGQVEFDGTTVTIERDGWMGERSHLAPTTIVLSDIARVEVHTKHLLVAGYIRFVTAGSPDEEATVIDAAYDDNAVLFKHEDEQEQFEALAREVEAAIAAQAQP